MSYDPLIIFLKVDQTDAERENAELFAAVERTQRTAEQATTKTKKETKEVMRQTKKMQREANRVQNEVRRRNRMVMRTVYQGLTTFSSVIASLPGLLTPLQEAAVSIATQAMMTVVQIQAILAAGTGGLSLVASAGPLALALLAFTATEIMILQKKDEAAREFRAAEAALSGLESIVSIWI